MRGLALGLALLPSVLCSCTVGKITDGMDMPGLDMAQEPNLPDADTCGAHCCADPWCQAFVFAVAPGDFGACAAGQTCCYLKSAVGHTVNSTIPRIATGTVNQCSVGDIEPGLDMPGYDLDQVAGLASPTDCGLACCGNPSCVAIVYAEAPADFGKCKQHDLCCYMKNAIHQTVNSTLPRIAFAVVHREIPPAPKLLWNHSTGNIVWSSPTVANGTVFAGSNDFGLYSLDARNGTLNWRFETRGHVQSSPAVSQGTVYVGSFDAFLYAVAETTGTMLWKYATGDVIVSSPALSDVAVYVGSGDQALHAVSRKNGSVIWRLRTAYPVDSTAAVSADQRRVYITYGPTLSCVGSLSGEVLWQINISAFLSSPALGGTDGGIVFAIGEDGVLFARNASDGSALWSAKLGASNPAATPVATASTVYAGSTSLVALSLPSGSTIWSVNLPPQMNVVNLALSGSLVAATIVGRPGIYGVDAAKGTIQWFFPAVVRTTPFISANAVFFGSDDKNVYAVDPSVS